jgi:hypothetical protein
MTAARARSTKRRRSEWPAKGKKVKAILASSRVSGCHDEQEMMNEATTTTLQ